MIAIIFLVILAWQFYIGYARGLFLQLYYTVSALVAYLSASFYYKTLADALTLWVPYSSPSEDANMFFFQSVNVFELDRVFYAGVAFVTIYTLVYGLMRVLGLLMHLFERPLFDDRSYRLIAGALEVLLTLTFANMVLTVLATIPLPIIQNSLHGQLVLTSVIHLPVFSHLLNYLWVTAILT